MKWILIVLVPLVVALAAGESRGQPFSGIKVDPAEPVAGQEVTLTVTGDLPNTCWTQTGHACLPLFGQELIIEVDTYDCTGRGCSVCLGILTPFEVTCTVVFPEPGNYLVRAVEKWDSLDFHFSLDDTLEVTVGDPSATQGVLWASLKSFFR